MADKEEKKNKKVVGFKEFDSAKYVELEPTIDEARSANGTAVVAWGRMNPITVGHEKLVNKVITVARDNKAVPHIFLSHSQDAKKNPLSHAEKIKFGQQAFGRIVTSSGAKTIIDLMKVLDNQFKNVILVAGSDRIKEFETLLNKYNGKEYKFADIKVVSAGERDPDGDSVSGMSASKMRQYAADDDIVKFVAGLPKKLKKSGDKVMAAVRKGMNMSEENDLEMDEALNRVQRFKKARSMRKARAKIKRGQERAKRKKADMKKIKQRAQKSARNMIKDRLAKPKKYASLSYAEKERIDKRMDKISPARIDRLARKMIPIVKKKEQERLASARSKKEEVDLDEQFTMFMEKMTKPQDSDVSDRPGSQPKGYYKGVDKNKKDARAAHFEKGAKMSDDNPAAYKPAPGDKEAKTKESKFTKKARAMGFTEDLIWEELVEGLDEGLWGKRVMKRPHMLYAANGKVKFDKRFKMYKPKDMKESVKKGTHISDDPKAQERIEKFFKGLKHQPKGKDMKDMFGFMMKQMGYNPKTGLKEANEFDIEDIAELYEATEGYMSEDKASKSLKDKAAKSGMPAGILRKVYNRGVAAWRTGHRPGTTPEQWGHARVNSFITKSSGTWGKADKDLADKVRKEETQLDEAPRRKGAPKMTGDSIAIQRAKDAEHAKAMGRSVKTGRKLPKKTMTSTQRSLASLRGEGNEQMPKTYKNIIEAATPAMKKAAASIEAYAKKHGGVDKADFMKAAKMLSSGNAGTNFVKFVDDLDTDPREWLITNLAKTMGKQTVEKMFKVKIREEVELDEDLTHQTVKPPNHTKKFSHRDNRDIHSIEARGSERHTVTSSQADAHDKTAAHHNEVADAHTKAGEKSSSPTLQRLHHQASVHHKKAAEAHFNASHSSSGADKDGSIQKKAKDMHMAYHLTMHANKMSQEARNKGTKAKRMSEANTHKLGESVELDETLSPSEKKLVNQMYDKKGNLTAIGKKVMNHGKKKGDKGYVESNLDEQATEFLEKYTAPTPEEIKKDKERDRKASGKQRPSMSAKSTTKKTYGGMMGGLKAGYGEEKSSKKHINTKPTIDEDEKEDLAKHAAQAIAKKKAAGEMDEYSDKPTKAKPRYKEMRNEASCGAGEQGTNELTKKYKKDTPMESIPPEVVGAALAAPMVAQGAKAAAKGAFKMAKKVMAKRKAKK